MSSRLPALLFAGACLLGGAAPLSAHEAPQVRSIALRDGQVDGVVTSRGVVVGPGLRSPTEATWLTCRQWFGLTSAEAPTLLGIDGALWLTTSRGAFEGDAAGCGWRAEPRYEGAALTGVRSLYAASERDVAFGVSAGALDGAIALGSDGSPRVLRASEASRFVLSIAPRAAGELFALLVELDPETNRPRYTLEVVRDDGIEVWGEIALQDDDVRMLLVGATPGGDALLEVSRYESTGRPDALVRVDEAGARHELSELDGPIVALRDGERTWIGDEGGLGVVTRDAYERVSAAFPVRALAPGDEGLLAGSAYPLGPMLARWDGAWTSLAGFDSVVGIAPCAQPDLASRCAEEWADWQRDVVAATQGDEGSGDDAGRDAGSGEGGAADGGTTSHGAASDGQSGGEQGDGGGRATQREGCATAGRRSAPLSLALVAWVAARRSRERRLGS